MALRDNISLGLSSAAPVAWEVSPGLTPYPLASAKMDAHVDAISKGTEVERVWLLEHPPLYTAGTSAMESDLVEPARFPVFRTGRGGQFTYHGPGQRVAYVILDLRRRGEDVRAYVAGLEEWIISTLDEFGIKGERREDRVGVWVRHHGREDKIAAIGIRIRHWVSFHGIAINVDPDLSHFSGIVPCGIRNHGVTSLADLGIRTDLDAVDAALRKNFKRVFEGT